MLRRTLTALALCTLLAGPVVAAPVFEQTVVASGLSHPWSLAFLPDGGMLVTEKNGGLVRIDAAGRRSAVAGLPDLDNRRLNPIDNAGLFDLVLHPDFRRNGLLYLSYSASGDGGSTTRLVRARLDGDQLRDLSILFEATPRSCERFHYGGGLVIGADGMLYLTVGERVFMEGSQPDHPFAQDPRDRRGKVYRFTLDGAPAPGNPDFGAGAVPGLYALGIRAAQGMTLHPETGDIWFTEHGPVGGDEINRLASGANYGWPNVTAGRFRDATYRPRPLPEGAATADPVHVWTDRTVAPTGLTFYSGDAYPAWRGDLFVTGLGRGFLMRLDMEGGRIAGVDYLIEGLRLRNVRQGPDGRLYLLTDEADGRIIRLDPVSTAPRP